MELILLHTMNGNVEYQMICFNPCFIGTYSFTDESITTSSSTYEGFNPCFIGTYSFTIMNKLETMNASQCFNPCFIGTYSFTMGNSSK